jgi:hypothetical protein
MLPHYTISAKECRATRVDHGTSWQLLSHSAKSYHSDGKLYDTIFAIPFLDRVRRDMTQGDRNDQAYSRAAPIGEACRQANLFSRH